jgi:hypothetical protein
MVPVMTDAVDPASLRAEHDQLMSRLSTRRSIGHFAHAAISLFAGLIVLGIAGTLYWDEPKPLAEWALGTGIFGVGLVIYGLVQYLRGRAVLAREAQEFARLSALRRALGIDDPAALLPR